MDSPCSKQQEDRSICETNIYQIKKKRAFGNYTFATICKPYQSLPADFRCGGFFFLLKIIWIAIAIGSHFINALFDVLMKCRQKFYACLAKMDFQSN